MSGAPKILTNMNVYLNGEELGFQVDEIALPKIAETIEDINTGYFKYPMFTGIERMETELTMCTQNYKMWLDHGLLNNSTGQLITFKSYQDDNAGEIDDIRMDMRGRFTEIDFGTVKRNEKHTHKVKGIITFFTYLLDDVPYYVIEPLTNTYIIGGINQLEKQNKAL